jgi:phytoene dehydrogenase-like protein
MFDLGEIGKQVGHPSFMKPYDGGGWVGVTKLDDEAGLRDAYEKSGKSLMHVQKGVIPFDRFVRCVGLGPQTILMNYDPSAPLHQRYRTDKDFVTAEQRKHIEDITLTINAFFGWDFNSCEALRKDGTFWPIDFANPCPDNQVNSIHYHWPWYVLGNLRWALFTAATRKPMRKTLDFEPFYGLARQPLPYRDKLRGYSKIARERFEADKFAEFTRVHLRPLERAAHAWFGSDRCRAAIRKKVAHVYPAHEVEPFTERFWQLVQQWRADNEALA